MSTTNHYFNGPDFPSSPEQRMIESLTIEAIKFAGHTFLYCPRDAINRDIIMGDDLLSEFNAAYELEMYIQNVDGFEGDPELISRFGYQMKDQAQVALAKRRFFDLFRGQYVRPREGDLLYFPMTKGIFEITFVQHENPFYQTGKIFVYLLNIQRFEYNHETFNTGRIEVDNIGINFENLNDVVNDPFADNKVIGDEGALYKDPDAFDPEGSW